MPSHNSNHHEVQEIMGNMPGWITRWASAGLLAGFLLLGLTTTLIRIPEQVHASALITSSASTARRKTDARLYVPVEQIAPVRVGQKALISLRAYPAGRYGYLTVFVKQVLPFNRADVVEVLVRPVSGWQTTAGYTIESQPVLKGEAVITISETSLFRRIWRQ